MKTAPIGNGRRIYQQVVEKMLALLDSGEYPPGVRLPSERELSEMFDVSRPSIREAIIALEVMGRVVVRTGAGVYVTKPVSTFHDAEEFSPFELTEARVLVEGETAALAASIITEEQLEEVRDAYRDMVRENEAGNLTSERADRKFHEAISKATNNRVLMSTIYKLWNIQEHSPDILAVHKSVCKKDGQKRLAEHKAILQALENRDPQAARQAMRRHFSRTINALHEATEAKAVEVVRREVYERRKRFSIERLGD
ncbi:FadR/GntR family transcriptional regulator [Microbulbifer thermotolerans]|uniref:GntR family transcriptional regulator n=1 Tax=Microbulbifer thermotolerans TaxID=252514 RepID=A0A143HIB5_MICTH|nr:FadR/GntR family transcriptional regulator [Microbulbifer thermotolerans]AMX01247.1 GntR family transcriptional regulator [Microbulbifer thermotolerans]MCX2778425.1 FadR family transcriptional regulator [Microbulbifer thermotolerans]MCX2783896.1 FadR family transcriptional regulator [Microbulbifer thermotolerans]MCX2793909.1 FadR family transcriptional regulator [Microbulbifer thermotolerans]MCX2805592.1 FadR family transcriptional regulator [Microbulbifer thermotolerans]